LRAEDAGLALALIPLVLVVMNVVYAASAYPMGTLSDRIDRRAIMAAGFDVLIMADIVLAAASNPWMVMLGVGLWGLHMGMTQGLLAALVAETAPTAFRGTAFGVFHLVTGTALLVASVVAGVLWQAIGPSATFLAGAGFTTIGLLGAFLLIGRRERQ
jgi:MFS family permease